jgi:hypothetical protein
MYVAYEKNYLLICHLKMTITGNWLSQFRVHFLNNHYVHYINGKHAIVQNTVFHMTQSSKTFQM